MQINRQVEILKIVFISTLFGCLWIFFSDSISTWFIRSPDLSTQRIIFKAVTSVITTSILLYFLINRLYTKIQQSINSLQESEKQLAFLVNTSSDCLIIVNPDKTQRYISPAAERYTGFSAAELEKTPLESVIHPDDIGIIMAAWDEIIRHPEKKVTFQYRHIHKTKDWVFSEAIAQNFLDDPIVRGIIASIRDITERVRTETALHETEAKLKTALASMTDAVFISDEAGNLLEMNDAWISFSRFRNREECLVILTDFPDLFEVYQGSSPPLPLDMWALPRALRGETESNVEYTIRRKDTGEIWIGAYSFNPIRNKKEEVIGAVMVARDITELKKKAQEQSKLKAQLQQAQKMEAIGTLAGGIAHDFNNILSVILGYSEMVKDDIPTDSRWAKDLEKVLEAGNRAKELVKQILNFSRQAQIDRIPIKINSLVKEGLKLLRSSIPTTIDITSNIASDSGIILADPTQIHQILMNLCTNAFHAMESTGGILSVSLKTTFIDPEKKDLFLHVNSGNYLELTVADTGVGIAPGVIEKIFDPYFTTKEIGKGTGLGLSIIHGIVKDLGGTITVESQLGRGSTFHVFFPVVEENITLPETTRSTDLLQGSERILYIDDEELLAEMGKTMLERLGYHVTVRRSSLEALATFSNAPNEFDLVITDQTMPNMVGSDLARRMLQIRPDIPIILCTGYSNSINEATAKEIGIREFALKPLTIGKTAELIRKIMNGNCKI